MAKNKAKARILWFDEVGIADIPLVGGKNASLGEMYRNLTKKGIRVPNGFAITASGYRHVLEQSNALDDLKKIEYSEFESLLKSSDIISLHVPLQPETFHLINANTIALMKRGVLIINTSRGKIVDTHALIEGLKSEHIGGVALDTYEEEEGVFMEDLSNQILLDDELSRLLTFPNVLITAHQGFFTHESLSEIARVTTLNILNAAGGRPFLADTCLA